MTWLYSILIVAAGLGTLCVLIYLIIEHQEIAGQIAFVFILVIIVCIVHALVFGPGVHK